MKISKAVITAAGFGTRFLPVSKTVQKEMLPILNRPLVDYVVADCVQAGVEEIIFVISEHNKQIVHFYRENPRLKKYLTKMGKSQLYERVRHLHEQVKITFLNQPDAAQYGTAMPVRLARNLLQNEDAFLVFMGDDFIYNADGSSETAAMIETFTQSGAQGLATCITKPTDQLNLYGVADVRQENNFTFLKTLVEKPAPGLEPSNLANVSKYIFTPKVFDILEHQPLNEQSGELYITDTITTLAKNHPVVIHTPKGRYLDGGNVLNWLKANLVVAKNDPELRSALETFIKKEFSEI